MIVLGLTGGIGCGKSTVAALLRDRAIAIVDADQVARDVVAPGTDGIDEIARRFGPHVIAADGSLDRKQLANIVFEDEARRRELNSALHPRIAQRSAMLLSELAAAGYGLALYEATLLVENNAHSALAGLIVVTARPDVQRARVMLRDGLSESDTEARVRAQLPLARKVAVATHVVDNSSTRVRLEARVADLYAELVLTYGPPRVAPASIGE